MCVEKVCLKLYNKKEKAIKKEKRIYMANFEKEFNEELEKRINEIENPNYEFPKQLNKFDYLMILIVVLLCFVGIVLGAFL